MNRPMTRLCALMGLALVGVASPALLRAGAMPALSAQEARAWAAVGVVNETGADGPAACSGTLVAPDLVLTAAHCAGSHAGPAAKRRFNIGGVGADTRLSVAATKIELHPAYTSTDTVGGRFAVDLAFLTLAAPVPQRVARPLAVHSGDRRVHAARVALHGFHRTRPAGLNGRLDCPARPGPQAGQITLACPVVSGNSGGPASVRTRDGYRVIGVAVARIGKGAAAQAIVTLLDPWAQARIGAALGRIGPRKSRLPQLPKIGHNAASTHAPQE